MTLNYLTSPYLRVRRADGNLAYVAPAEIAATGEAEPVAFATGLPLLDAFATELLIALFQYAVAPESERGVLKLIRGERPSVESLHDTLAAAADGFDLYGDAPAFQDPSLSGKKPSAVTRLFPYTPDAKPNAFKRSIWPYLEGVNLETAMLGLAFMQAHCSGGGAGYKTSISAGGPLRTWIAGRSLYETVVCNLLPRARFRELGTDETAQGRKLPWLNPFSGHYTSANAAAETVYFATPRRLLLPEPKPASTDNPCGITGETNGSIIDGVIEASGGANYEKSTWRHPLTPYYFQKEKGVIQGLPRRAMSVAKDTAWRERSGLFGDNLKGDETGTLPAEIVRTWRDGRARNLGWQTIPVRCFGLQFVQQAKVGGTVDLPFTFRALPSDDPDAIALFEGYLAEIVEVGETMVRALGTCLRQGLYGPAAAGDLPRDWGREHQAAFWQRTQAPFDRHVADLAEALADADDVAAALATPERQRERQRFQGTLRATALDIFDAVCAPGLDGAHALDISRARVKLAGITTKEAKRGVDAKLLEAEAA